MTDENRPDPDALLAAIQKEERQQKRGKLKIFLGMSAGVGKTYAMLEAALKQKSEGKDVLVGFVETHGRKETEALAQKLPSLPRKEIEYRGIKAGEFDLDALLAKHPQIALVDELPHTNVPGSRHPKRYQDILELLEAGIDIYTTLNVQHVESRADTVEQITGSKMQETVPDSVLDGAEIELIDISPDDLLKRLDEGKVYMPDRAAVAMLNFFREGNLTALREMALRLAAERVGQDVRDYMQAMQIDGPWKTGHRLLVAVSPSPLSHQMIRWTRRLADSWDCPWMAVYVESSCPVTDAEQTTLTKNLSVARELGAEVITTTDDDVVDGILRVARQHNATQIVVGKPVEGRFTFFPSRRSFLNRLIRESGDIDVHVVRAEKKDIPKPKPVLRIPTKLEWPQYLTAFSTVLVVTLLNFILQPFIGYRAIALNYLLAIVLLALFVGRGPVLIAATLSALTWNWFFLPPAYTFYIRSFEDVMMFGMYFVVAIILGQLISRVRAQEKAERRREERSTALYLLTSDLAQATALDDLVGKVVEQISKVFQADVAVIIANDSKTLSMQTHPASTLKVSEKEMSVAAWVFQHQQQAGRFTDNLPSSEALYLPLTTSKEIMGVIGIKLCQDVPPSIEQRNLLEAFARQAALVIDRQRLQGFAETSRVLAESERLGKNLLDSISHEMRTPISAITGAVSGLAEPGINQCPELHQKLVDELQEATERLNRLVGNLLDITRVESGHLKPKMEWCDVGDLIHVTVKSVEKSLLRHKLKVELADELPLVQMDFVLMEQALANLLLNAGHHTPAGTEVEVNARVEDNELMISVSDSGRGLPSDSLERIFEKFYRVPGSPSGGTGLGLSIVKGFVEAQSGRIKAGNRSQGGAVFAIYIPIIEPPAIPAELK
jgi:two-component system sensor histidine kinase KdpD